MKLDQSTVIGLLVICLFVGIIIISIGLGAEFPIINTAMSPLVCSGDKMVPAWKYEGPEMPFDVSVQGRWVCVDSTTGAGRAEGMKTTVVSGVVYGLIIFTIFIVRWQWGNRSSQSSQ